ncbi:iron complex transport system substrate-binding protein [Clostridium cochlearium]|uniref:Iron complex transport system substrate-binding protein n=1 Tax=Clostridium cochlearium TaxID=1494 RepID=A0ABY0QLW9_CLOCO|nr:ABC transporter substrate-binding protein [Clostridium cochlearium]SDL20668.1 iron complex transport system substrate-binding protein [Clostridium cochlearium]
MKSNKIKIVLFMLILTLGLTACVSKQSTKKDEVKTKIVTDTIGREVTISDEVNKIAVVPIPWSSMVYAIDGTGDKIVGMNPSAKKAYKKSMLKVLSPEMEKVNTEFIDNNFTVNIEEALKIKPDLFIQWDNQEKNIKQLTEAGIPTIALKYGTQKDLENGIKLIGQVLKKEDRANKLIEYHNENLKYFESKQELFKNKKKPKVLYLRDEQLKVAGNKSYNNFMIDKTGGINVAKDVPGQWVNVNMEQIIKWNPEIIYVSNFSDIQPDDLINNKIKGQDWSQIDAVKNKKVYKTPIGMYRWDAPCAESHLMFKWMGNIQQPDIFNDYKIENEIRKFYKDFLNYDLSKEEIKNILNKK